MVHNKHFFGKGLRVFLIGLSAILLTFKPSFAQVFPVQANITVVPPYSVYLSHYTSSEQEKVLVSILLRDPIITSLDVKLRFTIEGPGVKLTTNPSWNPQPFNLTGGVLVNLPQDIIADYLKPQHLLTEGVNQQDFFRGGKLPEGFYQFKVEVIEYRRNIAISNVGRAALWLMLNEAPRIVFPLAGQKVKSTNPQMLNFSWTPSGTSSPLSNLTTQYEFTLVEMVDNSMDPNVAITTASNASKFVRVLDQTSLLYGPADMPLTPGKTYAIRIKAFNTEGYELYKNNGYSQVQTFTFGDACPVPISFNLSNPKQSQFDVDVVTDPSNTAWQVRFRESGSGDADWSELKSEPNTTSKTPKGLKPKTDYEVQVRGLCGDLLSDYTQSQTITTTKMVDANRACNNNATPFVVGQAGPLGSLKVNDVFLAALFPVKVKEIKKQGGGKFSGRGFATLPLFNTGLAVTFDDISINSLMQLTAGEVVVVRDKLNMTLFGETENPTTGGADGETGDGGGTSDNPDYPPIKDTIVIPAVYDTLIVTGNTITYYLPNSTEPVTIDLGGEGSTLLVPADGKMENAKIVFDGAAHPYTPGQGGTSTADPVNFTGLFARFKANPQQTYGFDTLDPKHNTIANYYKQLTFANRQFYLPWKALKEGTPEPVNLVIKQGTDKMPFSNLKVEQTGVGSLTPLTGAGTGLQTYNLRGSYKGAEESVLASFTLDGEEKYAGAIYLATYGEKNFKVYLVPLNGATVEDVAAAQLQQGLNSIYSQAVVKWIVEPLNGMPAVELGENGLDWADKEMLSSYNGEMNSVISSFKTWKPTADRDAYYLFIVPKFSEGSVEGFMPRNRSFGFITKEQIVDRTVAHELGHGVFNLKHTFSDWAIQQGSTDNLMDYAQGTKLLKPQWDYIHDPEFTTGIFDDMEDGALIDEGTELDIIYKKVNDDFEPGKKDLSIEYSITKLEDVAKVHKDVTKVFLWIFKDGEFVYVAELPLKNNNTFKWNGKTKIGNTETEIKDLSDFTIKIGVTIDYSYSVENIIEWLFSKNVDFKLKSEKEKKWSVLKCKKDYENFEHKENMQNASEALYLLLKEKYKKRLEDLGVSADISPIDYLNESLVSGDFLGREIPSINIRFLYFLRKLEEKLGRSRKWSNNSIEFNNLCKLSPIIDDYARMSSWDNSLSDHATGFAFDYDKNNNPILTGNIYQNEIIQIVTGKKILDMVYDTNNGVEELRQISDNFKVRIKENKFDINNKVNLSSVFSKIEDNEDKLNLIVSDKSSDFNNKIVELIKLFDSYFVNNVDVEQNELDKQKQNLQNATISSMNTLKNTINDLDKLRILVDVSKQGLFINYNMGNDIEYLYSFINDYKTKVNLIVSCLEGIGNLNTNSSNIWNNEVKDLSSKLSSISFGSEYQVYLTRFVSFFNEKRNILGSEIKEFPEELIKETINNDLYEGRLIFEKGFFNLDVLLVKTLVQTSISINNENIELKWGGNYGISQKDFMHFELKGSNRSDQKTVHKVDLKEIKDYLNSFTKKSGGNYEY